jgi:uncharacterized protein
LSKAVIIAASLMAAACDQGQARRAAPLPLTGRVVDQANLIGPAAEQALDTRLAKLEAQTGDQLVVVTTASLGGATIEEYGLALGNGWRIGDKDLDNGVLLILAPNEHKVRIEVGTGLEGLLTDAKAAEIIRDTLSFYQSANFEGGLVSSVARMESILRQDRRRPQRKASALKKAA